MFNQSGENTWVVFVYGYFMSPKDEWNIRTREIAVHKNNSCVLQPDWSNMNLFLFLFHTTHNKIIIRYRAENT